VLPKVCKQRHRESQILPLGLLWDALIQGPLLGSLRTKQPLGKKLGNSLLKSVATDSKIEKTLFFHLLGIVLVSTIENNRVLQ